MSFCFTPLSRKKKKKEGNDETNVETTKLTHLHAPHAFL